jgi:hypothetical protein
VRTTEERQEAEEQSLLAYDAAVQLDEPTIGGGLLPLTAAQQEADVLSQAAYEAAVTAERVA